MENKELSFEECLKQLEEIVANLENKDISYDYNDYSNEEYEQQDVVSSQLVNILNGVDLNNITPLQALKILAELKELSNGN